MKIIFLFFLVVSACFSCSRQPEYIFESLTGDFDIMESADKTFILDSETTQMTDCLQFADSLLIFSNEYDNSLVFYDFLTGRFKQKIKLAKEGSDGVGTSIFTYYKSKDSIFVWNYHTNTLFLLGSNAKKKWQVVVSPRFSTSVDSLLMWPVIMPRTNNLMTQSGDKLILSGMFFGEMKGENSTNRPVLIEYDLRTGGVSYGESYPSIYHKGNWGGGFMYRFPYHTANSTGDVVLSFAADPVIRVHKIGDFSHSSSYYAGIGGNEPPIPPIEEKAGSRYLDEKKSVSHYMCNLSYSSIHYDKWNRCYYRVVNLPQKQEVDLNAPIMRKPLALIILDDDFQIICRKLLPDYAYLINQCFVSPEGFHIQVESDNDDIMRFKTFKLCRK